MARFDGVEAAREGSGIRLRFRLEQPCVLGWQVFDPATGAFLFEGQSADARDAAVDIRVDLPAEDGPYRVQVAPVADRDRFILIEAHIQDGELHVDTPRVASQAALRRARAMQAIPKAFVYPVRSLWSNRKLIGAMVRRDISARYRGSLAGSLWTFLNPLLLMVTYFFVFGVVLQTKFGADTSRTGYVLYFLAGMLPWLPFSEAVGRSPYIVIEHRNFVKKLVFPLETLPVNLVLSGFVTEVFALLIFVIGLFAARGAVPATVAWLPVLLIPQFLLAAGICWFLAALGVYTRDLGQIVGYVLTLWFFLTPICYEERPLPHPISDILAWNPLLVLVRGYRAIFLQGRAPEARSLLLLTAVSLALAILGHGWFHRLRRSFADVI